MDYLTLTFRYSKIICFADEFTILLFNDNSINKLYDKANIGLAVEHIVTKKSLKYYNRTLIAK